ncbi:MAG: succinyl-diaminopimelate desuccinylase [Gammaproteobacteria bacterium]|nr:succinyl-diaminopimelate desuccinylase [Gammaproteobacteria bacterium]
MTDADLSATTRLAQELISRPSVTPDDAGCQPLLASRLEAVGFTTEPMPFGDVSNLWARHGTTDPLFVFAGHTDVVPTGPAETWSSDPFSAQIAGDMIMGRGAADMKGSVAAMVTACERFLNAHTPTGSIAFLLTSDEEGPAIDGTRKVIDTLQARRENIDWCLVGEPTSVKVLGDTIKNGRRGSLSGALTVHGIQGHVAYPHLANNPFHAALPALLELTQITWDKGNAHFPPTTLQVSNIHAGTGAGNVIPGELEVRFNLRFSTELTPEAIQQQVTELLQRHELDFSLEWSLSGMPFITEPGTLTQAVASAIRQVTGTDTELDTGGGTSDGRFIAPTGAQVIELGPLNATIHQVNECISRSDLDTLSEIYEHTLVELLT